MSAWTAYGFAACDVATPASGVDYESQGHFLIHASTPYRVAGESTRVNWRGDAWRFDYEYLALDFPGMTPDAPVTNGDLHALAVGYRDRVILNDTDQLHREIAPTLAVSSNQLKNPEKIGAGALRIDGGLLWAREIGSGMSWFAGGCLTALTGEHRLIPVVGTAHRYGAWTLSPGYPRSTAHRRLTPRAALYADWSLTGNAWEVLDKSLSNRSKFHREGQQLRLGVTMGLGAAGRVEVLWLRRFDQRFDYRTVNGDDIAVDASHANGWVLRYAR